MAAYPGSIGFVLLPPGPAGHAWVIDPSDSVPLPAVTRAIYVGDTGDVAVQMAGVDGADDGSNPTVFAAVPAGTTLWISATFIMDTDTTSNIVIPLW